ncbi:hypothetical protein FQR65_LT07185 [Abscondita terminalis]|nr:hypothetical protein FQR65_LT07185 [Abscondita terminalis]
MTAYIRTLNRLIYRTCINRQIRIYPQRTPPRTPTRSPPRRPTRISLRSPLKTPPRTQLRSPMKTSLRTQPRSPLRKPPKTLLRSLDALSKVPAASDDLEAANILGTQINSPRLITTHQFYANPTATRML